MHLTGNGPMLRAAAAALQNISDPARSRSAESTVPDFDALYQRHFDFVWRTLRRHGVPDTSMDDAVQDVFLVAHARLSSFEGRSSLRTWLFGVARRVARNHRGRSSARAEAVGTEALEALPDLASSSPLATAETIERARLLERLLAAIAPQKREAFILVELEEMSISEASEVLEVNANTVASRVRAARQELEEALARLEAHEDWRRRCPS
jgi:RNA polymerase sigma-70 factor (ECF subfamily)